MKLDAPFYTEDELDRLERSHPREALRIARQQAQLKRAMAQAVPAGAVPPTEAEAREALEAARGVLLRDGGDLEFVSIEAGVLTVRLKGACAGCPRAPLDLKQVVEAMVRKRYPAVREVRNVY